MGGSFATSDSHSQFHLKPLRVPARREEVFQEACNLAHDLPGWQVENEDASSGTLVCRRKGSVLAAAATLTIHVEGPDGIPSATVNARSESEGGLLSRDRAHVLHFMKLFHRRVC
ncbi:MAG: hypothetical protein ACKVWV_19405 [Planctomycetota bacterium]